MSDPAATDRCKRASASTGHLRLAPLVALLLVSIAGCAKTALRPPTVEEIMNGEL